jgi:hypothetical protein
MEGKTRLICEVKANPKLVDFTWMLNNSTLTTDIVHMGLQSILTIDGPPPVSGVYYCYVNNSVGLATPCEINVEGNFLFETFCMNRMLTSVPEKKMRGKKNVELPNRKRRFFFC